MTDPVYYELSWSILSTIGIANTLFGLMVAGITSFGPVSIVPIVTSAAGAIANGLCYYAFYDDENTATHQAVASIFADILWLVGLLNIGLCDLLLINLDTADTRSRPVVLQLYHLKSGIARPTLDHFRDLILVHDHLSHSHSSCNRRCSSPSYSTRS